MLSETDWLNLGLFHAVLAVAFVVDMVWRKASTWISICLWSLLWIGMAMLMAIHIYFARGSGDAQIFLAAYVLEKSLSLDNVFVFWLIFNKWGIPWQAQHRVLMWGVCGAIFMRGIMITVGVHLIQKWHSVLWIFGFFLLLAGAYTLCTAKSHRLESTTKPLTLPSWVSPCTHTFWSQGRPTVLLAALVCVEWSDVVFAIDSVPAIFGFTQDPFLIYTSNIMAILGLRALYELMQAASERMAYLPYAAGCILMIVGLKMLGLIHLSPMQATSVTIGILVFSIKLPQLIKN